VYRRETARDSSISDRRSPVKIITGISEIYGRLGFSASESKVQAKHLAVGVEMAAAMAKLLELLVGPRGDSSSVWNHGVSVGVSEVGGGNFFVPREAMVTDTYRR
jgi:hypothetical protein